MRENLGSDDLEKIGLHDQILDFGAIRKEPNVPSFVLKLIDSIEERGAILVGDWLQTLAHLDFLALKIGFDSLEGYQGILPLEDESKYISGICLIITELLAVGEGLAILADRDERIERVQLLKKFIEIESLKRKGVPLYVFYENMSLDETFSIDGESPLIVKFLGE